MRCAVCKEPVAPKPDNEAYPFCSDRCRLIDLGKWLDEDYRIAGPAADLEDGRVSNQQSAISSQQTAYDSED